MIGAFLGDRGAHAEFERAAAQLVERLNAVEQRQIQYQRIQELEHRQKGYDGPTL